MSDFASKWDSPCHLNTNVSYRQYIMAQRGNGATQQEVAEALGPGFTRNMIKNVEAHSTASGLSLDAVIEAVERDPSDRELLRLAVMNPPVVIGEATVEVERLRGENADLRLKLQWALHAAPEDYQGGKLTLTISDLHWGDRAHLRKCWASVVDKIVALLKQYQPEILIVIVNGDAIAGRGIYKEQHMDSTMPSTVDQVHLGVVKLYDFHQAVTAACPGATVRMVILSGNHDRNMGEPTAPLFVAAAKALGLPVVYAGLEYIENCASDGTYNVWFEHGFGHSDLSPSSPKYVAAMKDKALFLADRFYGENRIRRFNHGHTHWFQLNMERVIGLFFDVTGGFQRNERVLLGKNVRPIGVCAYISPKGYNGVLDPIGIQPDSEVLKEEIASPFLMNANMRDAADCLERYEALALAAGLITAPVDGVTPGGR